MLKVGTMTAMRGEETPDEPSRPSESGISCNLLDDLDLERVLPLTEVWSFEVALWTIVRLVGGNVVATSTIYLEVLCAHDLAQELFEEP